MYVSGLRLNLAAWQQDTGERVPWLHRSTLYVTLVVLMPVFGLLEAAAVMYGMVRPERGFTVITKSNVTLDASASRPPPTSATPSLVPLR